MKIKKDFYTFDELLQDPKWIKGLSSRQGIAYETAGIIERVRNEMGWTQAELARKIRTTQSSIARAEGGKIAPGLEFIDKIARAMGTRAHVVFESMPHVMPTGVKYAYLAKPATPASPAPKSAVSRAPRSKKSARVKIARRNGSQNRASRADA